VGNSLPAGAKREALGVEAEFDIFGYREPREKRGILKHDRDIAVEPLEAGSVG
jgi:hypothetical protein